MEEVSKIDGGAGTGPVARECYKKTLAHFHPWFVQKSASLAMYTLPTRDQLVATAFVPSDSGSGDSPPDEWKLHSEQMTSLAKVSNAVYESVQKLYEEKQLLDLP